ncbi:hypothetical protein BX666DRAFT_1830061, partial [Dichotomocladium elegans]
AFFQLALVCEENGIWGFNSSPLHRLWSPCHMEIDTKIACYHILRCKVESHISNMEYWRRVVNMKSKAFKPQESELLEF